MKPHPGDPDFGAPAPRESFPWRHLINVAGGCVVAVAVLAFAHAHPDQAAGLAGGAAFVALIGLIIFKAG